MLTVYDILITRREMHAYIIASCHIKIVLGNNFFFFNLLNKKTKENKENKRIVVKNNKVPIISVNH